VHVPRTFSIAILGRSGRSKDTSRPHDVPYLRLRPDRSPEATRGEAKGRDPGRTTRRDLGEGIAAATCGLNERPIPGTLPLHVPCT